MLRKGNLAIFENRQRRQRVSHLVHQRMIRGRIREELLMIAQVMKMLLNLMRSVRECWSLVGVIVVLTSSCKVAIHVVHVLL